MYYTDIYNQHVSISTSHVQFANTHGYWFYISYRSISINQMIISTRSQTIQSCGKRLCIHAGFFCILDTFVRIWNTYLYCYWLHVLYRHVLINQWVFLPRTCFSLFVRGRNGHFVSRNRPNDPMSISTSHVI